MMCSSADWAAWVGDFISGVTAALTAAIAFAAFVALGTWRIQNRAQLAERCLDAAHDFSYRIKVVRMEVTGRETQIEEIRQVLLEFQRIFVRLSRYVPAPVSEDGVNALLECFSLLDTNFCILKRYDFREPPSPGGESQLAIGASAQERGLYRHANDVFFGLSEPDQIAVKQKVAARQLDDALAPMLRRKGGWLARMIDRIAASF